jgi:predicted phage tail protein
MRATDQLSAQSARKLGVICTRKLPVWNGSAWSAPTTTRSPAWALADILRASYGAVLADTRIDLAQLVTLAAEWSGRGDTLDCVFDGRITVWEALGKVARAGRARPYMQGGRVHFARDRLETGVVAMFTPANMLANSFSIQYIMPSEQTAEEIRVRYFSETTWKQAETIYTLASTDPDRFAEVDLFGVTNAAQALREATYLAQTNRYRRRLVSFGVELEGMILSPLDPILISHDLPDWGQFAEAEAWNAVSLALTVDRPLTWGAGTHYARVRQRNGSASASIAVTQGATADILIFATSPGTIDLTGRDRSHIAFGAGTAWQVKAKVLTIQPKDEYTATVTAVIENDLVHGGC